MFAGSNDFLSQRCAKSLFIPHYNLPEDVTEDDVFEVFGQFGVIDIEVTHEGTVILFETIRGAAEAEKYWIFSNGGTPHMMGGSMRNGHPMMGAMHHMVPPMGMMMPGASLQCGRPSRSVPMQQQFMMPQGPSANVKVVTNSDGSRRIFSPPTPEAAAAAPTAAGGAPVDEGSNVVTGQCSLCKKHTSYTCGRCGIFYCSRECQKQNWPTHQTTCNAQMPPLNFAGKRQLTEVEINNCPMQQQLNHRDGRRSPMGKQSSTWRNHSNTEVSQDQKAKPQMAQNGTHAGMKDEVTPSSSFNRSSERPGGNERRFDGHSYNRGPPGSSQRPEQRGFRRGDHQGGSQGRNFVKNRSEDENTDRNPTSTASTSKSSMGENVRSPRSVPSGTGAQQDSASETVSPIKPSNTAATLLKNLQLNTPKMESPSKPAVTTPPDVPEEKVEKPESVSITSGSEVMISHIGNDCIYLQSSRDLPQLVVVTNELKVHGSSVPTLQRQPKKREFLGAKFKSDNAYYRAVVEKKVNGLYEVHFVDFGNSEAGLTNADMIPLTKGLAKVPCMAVKVCLKDVPAFSDAALTILKSLFCGESFLTVEFGNDLAAGVTLFEKNGDSVNVKLLKAMGLLSSPTVTPTAPVVAAPAAAPASIPVVAAPTPIPIPVVYLPPIQPAPVVAAPDPAPVQVEPTPAPAVAAPGIAPVPVVAAPAPVPVVAAPAPAPVVAAPAPAPVVAAPAPAPVVAAPAPAPVVAAPIPAPVVAAPIPAPVVAAPIPAPVVAAPIPVAAAPAKRFFSFTEIKYVPFPPAGSKCPVLLNHFHKDAGFFMACPLDVVAIEIATQLGPKLEAYAVNAEPYRPEPNELCLAKWTDDAWYRAFCLDHAGNDKFNVMFLEYGNTDTIPYPNFRPFTEEFLKYPALSSPCMLSEPSPLSEAQKAKLQSMFKDEWVVEATVIQLSEEKCTLDIPEIKNALT